jgi:hypothetical protein
MMGRQAVDQSQLFYLFNLEARIPAHHLLRRINPTVTRILAGVREKLGAFYSEIGRPSIDPELMIRMLIVGYCYGIRSERRLCEEGSLTNTSSLAPTLCCARREKDRIDMLVRGVQGGVFSPNEARAEEDLPAVEYGAEPRVQMQVVPLSAAAPHSALLGF